MMTQFGYPVVTTLVALPLAAAVALLFVRQEAVVRAVTLVVGLLECLLALPLFAYDPAGPAFQ